MTKVFLLNENIRISAYKYNVWSGGSSEWEWLTIAPDIAFVGELSLLNTLQSKPFDRQLQKTTRSSV